MRIKDERNQLESLLGTASNNIGNDNPAPNEKVIEELKTEPTIGIDFDKLRIQCTNDARIMVNNSLKFILPKNMIEGNKYLEDKIEIDIISLSGMIYQLRSNEAMQKVIMNEVDRGLVNNKMFDSFTQLSKTIGELNKQLLGTVEAIKSTYKEIKNDIREKQTDALGAHHDRDGMITQGDGGVVTLGTKELINHAKRNPRKDIQDAEEIDSSIG